MNKHAYLGHEQSARTLHLKLAVPHVQQQIGAVGRALAAASASPAPLGKAVILRMVPYPGRCHGAPRELSSVNPSAQQYPAGALAAKFCVNPGPNRRSRCTRRRPGSPRRSHNPRRRTPGRGTFQQGWGALPQRPTGVRRITACSNGVPRSSSVISVKYQPGTIALTWMPSGASSTALTLVNPIMPCFATV